MNKEEFIKTWRTFGKEYAMRGNKLVVCAGVVRYCAVSVTDSINTQITE